MTDQQRIEKITYALHHLEEQPSKDDIIFVLEKYWDSQQEIASIHEDYEEKMDDLQDSVENLEIDVEMYRGWYEDATDQLNEINESNLEGEE